ncbi:MAG: type IV secretory system conjugative DNA transfer family protein [Clostridia bacterium]
MKEYFKNSKTNLVSGKIDSGKTTGVMFSEVKRIIENEENLLVLDLKSEYYQEYYNTLKDKGYEIAVINLADSLKSNNYNPLTLPFEYYKNNQIDKAIELIEKLAKRIFEDNNVEGDPFWANTSADLFTGLSLMIMKEAKSVDEVNIGSVSLAMNLNDNTLMKDYLSKLNANDPIYITASSTIYAPNETRGSILSVAKQKIKSYCVKPNLLALLCSTNFDLLNIKDKKTAFFVILNEDNIDTNDIANIFVDQIYYLIKEKNIGFNILLDNIDFIHKLDSLYSMLNIPLAKVKTIVATRNIDELKTMYPSGTFNNIITNIKIKGNKVIRNDEEEEVLICTDNKKHAATYPITNLKTMFFKVDEYLNNK